MDIKELKILQAAARIESDSKSNSYRINFRPNYGGPPEGHMYDTNFALKYTDPYEYERDKNIIKDIYRKGSIERVILSILKNRKSNEEIVLSAVDSLMDDVPEDHPEFVLYLRDILHEWVEALASFRK